MTPLIEAGLFGTLLFAACLGAVIVPLALWLAFDSDEKPESYDPSSPFEADFYAKEAAPWSSP